MACIMATAVIHECRCEREREKKKKSGYCGQDALHLHARAGISAASRLHQPYPSSHRSFMGQGSAKCEDMRWVEGEGIGLRLTVQHSISQPWFFSCLFLSSSFISIFFFLIKFSARV